MNAIVTTRTTTEATKSRRAAVAAARNAMKELVMKTRTTGIDFTNRCAVTIAGVSIVAELTPVIRNNELTAALLITANGKRISLENATLKVMNAAEIISITGTEETQSSTETPIIATATPAANLVAASTAYASAADNAADLAEYATCTGCPADNAAAAKAAITAAALRSEYFSALSAFSRQ